ncbi:hypothetical protein Sango_1212700 [Sesamum angolense]|uniref:Uncharacterized protein n=1 Tax=Sesamum angolense TaxID=2727404 RepID=A0AAE1WX61_9LAMI|nr:hypothetical protein Sango_1212700 [Sesamum angolense]
MTRGKQKIEAQRKNAEKNQKAKGSQLEARADGLKVICPILDKDVSDPNKQRDFAEWGEIYGLVTGKDMGF